LYPVIQFSCEDIQLSIRVSSYPVFMRQQRGEYYGV